MLHLGLLDSPAAAGVRVLTALAQPLTRLQCRWLLWGHPCSLLLMG